jgi:hypothetical protein
MAITGFNAHLVAQQKNCETIRVAWVSEALIKYILRKVWGGSRTWVGARAQSVLMSVWRTCWQQGRSALDFLSQFLRGTLIPLALPP